MKNLLNFLITFVLIFILAFLGAAVGLCIGYLIGRVQYVVQGLHMDADSIFSDLMVITYMLIPGALGLFGGYGLGIKISRKLKLK